MDFNLLDWIGRAHGNVYIHVTKFRRLLRPLLRRLTANRLVNFRQFLKGWNNPLRQPHEVLLRRTQYGNINSSGIPGNYTGPALARWHPQFEQSLEGGVRKLVLLFVNRYDLVTYSSCTGHLYEGARQRPVTRYVSIARRSSAETVAVMELLPSR